MDTVDIKKLRKSLKMTQKEFGAYCGVTERTVQNWEAGAPIPQIMQRLCNYLDAENNACCVSTDNVGNNSIVGMGINEGDTIKSFLDEIAAQRHLTEAALANAEKSQEHISQLTTAVINLSSK